jgi:hypothetical protein
MLVWLRGVHERIASVARSVPEDPHEEEPPAGPEDLPVWVLDDDHQHSTLVITRAALLARVEAERALLAWAEEEEKTAFYGLGTLGAVVRRIAAGWRHMPGYREEWKP